MAQSLDNSWQRLSEARIRMRENGLKLLLDGLGEDGFCLGAVPRVVMDDEGVYIEILFNTGKHGSIVAVPLEILIPAKLPSPSKKKKVVNEKKADETQIIEPTGIAPTKLHVVENIQQWDEIERGKEPPCRLETVEEFSGRPTVEDTRVQKLPDVVC